MAVLEPDVINKRAPLTQNDALEKLHSEDNLWENDPALRLVIRDADRAESYVGTKSWLAGWPQASILYQSPYEAKYWENTYVPRASIPSYVLATTVNSLVSTIMHGLFYDDPPFMIQKHPKTAEREANAIEAIIGYQLEDEGVEFRREVEFGVRNALLFGTAMWKWGWETFTRERTRYERKTPPITVPSSLSGLGKPVEISADDDLEEVVDEEYVDRPFFEHIKNLREILVDPGLAVPDIRKGKFVIHRMYMTFNDLDKLREKPGYKIPSQEELINLFFPPKEPVEAAPGEVSARNPLWDVRSQPRYDDSTDDPFNQPLEVLERWDNDSVIVVLQKKVVICNDKNPYGKIPFLSVGWWDVPEAFYGLGLSRVIGSEQRFQQGLLNNWIDMTTLKMQGVYVRTLGKGQQSQNLRLLPGKIVNIELDANGKGDLKPLQTFDPVPEAGEHMAMSQARVELMAGANEVTSQGIAGNAAHSNMGRTAAGANLIASGASSRPQDFVDKFANQVFVPFLYEVHDLNRKLLPKETIQFILDDELEQAYFKNGGTEEKLRNARVIFSVLAGSKMQERRQMAQSMPLLVQILTNQQAIQQVSIANKIIDVAAIFEDLIEVTGWKTRADWIRPMTPEEQQRAAMQSPVGQIQAKAQAQAQTVQQQHDNKLDVIDAENVDRAAREVLRHAYQAASTPEALSGAPAGGPQTFGGEF